MPVHLRAAHVRGRGNKGRLQGAKAQGQNQGQGHWPHGRISRSDSRRCGRTVRQRECADRALVTHVVLVRVAQCSLTAGLGRWER
jgi:hypothetical protein